MISDDICSDSNIENQLLDRDHLLGVVLNASVCRLKFPLMVLSVIDRYRVISVV